MMRSRLMLPVCAGLLFLVPAGFLRAEDWKTTDGQTYQDVTVVKTEPDAVTILHHDGGGRIPMEKLPPELKERFHYDAVAAKAATDARAATEAQEQAAMMLAEAQKLADAAMKRAAEADAPADSANSSTGGDGGNTHHSLQELNSSMHTLRAPADPRHHTMGELASSMHTLSGN